jgi:glycerophosphoryl diester phosphodiesterase
MQHAIRTWALAGILTTPLLLIVACSHSANGNQSIVAAKPAKQIQVGVRPYFLIEDMDEGALKQTLLSCSENAFTATAFSIGHRGAPLQFPEHTRESYIAAARMGAGILECDVTFTKDKELVCRHSQCDLHTTTNIVATELGQQCRQPFVPAVVNADGTLSAPASAQCCTSDITLAQFKTLRGKMDASDPTATTPEQYLGGTANWRTDLYASRGTLMTHRESIELFNNLNVKMAPELKSPAVPMPFAGMTQQDYAHKLIREYEDAGIAATNVFPQSFMLGDVVFWVQETPEFGQQAVFLDGRLPSPDFDIRDPASLQPSMQDLAGQGVRILAPPFWMLLDLDAGKIVPSAYANAARNAGLDIITWTLERSGPLANGGGYDYQTVNGLNQAVGSTEPGVINNDGDMLTVLDVLAREVGVIGIFSDWPGTVTYYANCMKL